ncbi:G-protein coupled receptor GRL101-like protein [Trichoplax sp. H2]|nr:G-protein coupled receptor GRL101-like protein [Trichoplax sp. H2]|eukprot:RDD44628.1 G-protein coupled receptor GRL101-like protein [Trichoplax sp. H2]
MESVLNSNTIARIFGWTLSIIGFIGNSTVIVMNHNLRKRKTYPNQQADSILHHRYNSSRLGKITLFLFTNLAVSDLFTVVHLFIILSADAHYNIWQRNNTQIENNSSILDLPNQWLKSPFCFLARFIIQLTFHLSIGISLIVTTDRYISILHPTSKYKLTYRIAKRSVLLFWLTSLLIASILVISSVFLTDYHVWLVYANLCITADINIIFIRILSFLSIAWALLATIIITFMYVMIFKTVKSVRLVLRSQCSIYERKVLKMAVIIVIANVISWLPIGFAAVIRITKSPLLQNFTYERTIPILLMCVTMTAAINPFIYIFSSYYQPCTRIYRSHEMKVR